MMQYGYQNPYYTMQDNLAHLRQAQMPASNSGGVLWVTSEQEAMAFLIAPNSAVALWDSTAPRVYLKQADASGKPTFKSYDLVERTETARDASRDAGASYVTREEFDALAASVRKLTDKKKHKEDNDE